MRLIINENILDKINEDKLPKFILKALLDDKHSLSSQPAFPIENLNKFEVDLLSNRYKKIINDLKGFNFPTIDIETVSLRLHETFNRIVELEQPIVSDLEKLCINIIKYIFQVDGTMVDFDCKLGEVGLDNRRDIPSNEKYSFNDTNQNREINEIIYQRRLVNSLIMGISQMIVDSGIYVQEIYNLNPELLKLYKDISILNDYLLFSNDSNEITPVGNVNAFITLEGEGNNSIEATATIFPALLYESIKGFLDLISFNSLPEELELASYVLGKADFKQADVWDKRFGLPLSEKIFKGVNDIQIIPPTFYALLVGGVEEFNSILREVFAETISGETCMRELVDEVVEQIGINTLTKTINQRNEIHDTLKNEYFEYHEL